MLILKLIFTAAGIPTEFDGRYVRRYDPTLREADGSYDGGIRDHARSEGRDAVRRRRRGARKMA